MKSRKKRPRRSTIETQKNSAELIALVRECESKNTSAQQKMNRIQEGIEDLHARVGPLNATEACAQALMFFHRHAS